jgi:hypothetical protein
MQPLNPGLVNQNFADSSPAADVIDAFHQAPDLGIDLAWKIAAFSLNYFQRYKSSPYSSFDVVHTPSRISLRRSASAVKP